MGFYPLTASEIPCYSGIAPVTESSGKQKWIHWRWACPKFLRQTFHEWAGLSTRKSEWARAYYDHQRYTPMVFGIIGSAQARRL